MNSLSSQQITQHVSDSLLHVMGTSNAESYAVEDQVQSMEVRSPEVTYGSEWDIGTHPFLERSPILRDAITFVKGIGQQAISRQSIVLLGNLQSLIAQLPWNEFNVENVPRLKPYSFEDGSTQFEWVHPTFRIGYNIDSDESKSVWYLVTNEEIGNIAASGFIDFENLLKLNLWLLTFLVLYSE